MRRHRVVFDWSRRLTAAALTIFAVYHFAPLPAQANGGEAWRLAEISGVVQVQRGDGAWRAAAPGTALVAGQALATGADGRAVLRADGDVITVSPGSHVLVPNEGGDASGANIVQRLGTLLYKVERAPQRRFAVDTPFLAAVVKGTVFTVVVRADGGALQVTEGAVEVAALASGEVALIRPGQIAQV
ncbi:MAG TPA: FecR family protein, partial [Alphaproteobacteria bacterium]